MVLIKVIKFPFIQILQFFLLVPYQNMSDDCLICFFYIPSVNLQNLQRDFLVFFFSIKFSASSKLMQEFFFAKSVINKS